MRFIWYWEYNQREALKMFEVNRRVGEDRKKHPDKYPKLIFGAHWLGMEPKGFTIYEVDNSQQIVNLEVAFSPIKKSKFVPIFEHKSVVETYEKEKEGDPNFAYEL
jgi:hypothetical protein